MKFFYYLFIAALAGWRSSSGSSEESALSCPRGMEKSICAGCWSRCPVQDEVCEKKDCEVGCACEKDGYVRHNGICIPGSQCPLIPKKGDKCPEGTVWNSCSGCNHYCEVTKETCVQGCRTGCVCEKKDQRMHFRECLNRFTCPRQYTLVHSCPKGTKWADCATCERFCAPARDCASPCTRGCVCENKNLAIFNEECMEPKDCPNISKQ